MPGEECLRRHREAGPAPSWEEATEGGQQRPISRTVERTLHLAPQNGDLVAQGEQLNLLRSFGATLQDDESKQTSQPEVDESPEPALCPLPAPHSPDGSRSSRGPDGPAQPAIEFSGTTGSAET